MWQSIKNLLKNTVFNIFLVFLLTLLVISYTFREDSKAIVEVISNVSIPMLIFIVGINLFDRFLYGVGLALECKETHPEYSYLQGYGNSYISGLFCGITPSSSGGQVAQAYVFDKQGIPYAASLGILWLDFIVYQVVMTLYVLILLILKYHYFHTEHSEFFFISVLGFFVSAFIIVVLFLLAKSKKFYTFVCNKVIVLLHKLHFIKDEKKVLSRLDDHLLLFSREIKLLSHRKKLIVQLVIINIIRFTIMFSLPFVCALALKINVSINDLLNIIALSAFVHMVNCFLPMPGSTGGTEAVFILMFSTIFSSVDAKSIMLLWRLLTYYLTIFIGSIVFMYIKIKYKEDK